MRRRQSQPRVRCQAAPATNAPGPTVFSSVKQTSMTDRRKKNQKKTWTDCRHGSIMRWIATRRKSRGGGGGARSRTERIGLSRARERKRKLKRQKKKISAHKQPPSYLLIRSQQCQAEFERLERQEEACINYKWKRLYTLSLGFMPKQTVRSRIHHGSRGVWRNEE